MIYTSYEEEQILGHSGLLDKLPEATLLAVKANYDEPHRHYHAWHHALSTVSWVNHCAEISTLPGYAKYELVMAALYHDAVYDAAGSPSNEERSVQLLRQHNRARNIPDMPSVEHLIMQTAKHGKLESQNVGSTEALFLDCDIASFGEARWEIVLWNERNIQAEYLTQYTLEQVQAGRKAFLTGFLAKRSIFLSTYFQDRFEAQARRNIARLIERLP